jgi:putative SOS response-associated peptidase YedK
MCGRYVIKTLPDELRRHFGYEDMPDFPPRYNVAPQMPVPIVRLEQGRRRFALVRWGLIPGWVKDPRNFAQLHNARAESVLDKPAFKNAMKYRRCLVPADGFYDWKDEGGGRKTPYFVHLASGGPMAFAGLWEIWSGPNGEELETMAVVTTEAKGALAEIHHRVPVILPPESYDAWLDCGRVDAEMAMTLIAPLPDDQTEAYPVSPAVNRVVNDSADLIVRVTPAMMAALARAAPPPKPRPPSAVKADSRQGSLF